LTVLFVGRIALADDKPRAAQLFREASSAYEQGKFAAAARAFEESDRIVPRAAALYNAALAWEAAGDPARSAEDYASAISRADLPADQAAGARDQLAVLSRKLGSLDVIAPADARIAVGSIEGHGPRFHLYVEPGTHDVVVTSPDGATESRTITIGAGASEIVRLGERAAPPPPPAATPLSTPASHDAGHSHRVPATVWALFGGSALFGGAAVALGLETLHARKTFDASNETSKSDHDEAVRFRLLTNVAWACAAASAALGGTLLVVSLTKDRDGDGDETRTALTVSPSDRTVGLRHRF
jgi:hypothetical protein